MAEANILWADDEIDLLKPHIMFLENKGYKVVTANSGNEAIDLVKENVFDIVFLDENMPGLSGLEALQEIKSADPTLPVIMITKSEEESIMEEAIGSKISDYLIKPVNPNQILLSVKKNLDDKRLIREKTTSGYQQNFRQIGMQLMDNMDSAEWAELYKKLVYWDLELSDSQDEGMEEIFNTQRTEANGQFGRFIKDNYIDWLHDESDDTPVMSHTLFKKKVAPILKDSGDDPVFLVVIDNLRYDQWKTLQPQLNEYYRMAEEHMFYSILPTATHYARNAIFSGLMPTEMEKMYSDIWKNEDDPGGKNLHEEEFLASQLKRLGFDIRWSYHKITNLNAGKKLSENFKNLLTNKLNVIVYNFVDMLSHKRTEMEVIKELADDESAYRSLTESWFEHSPLLEVIRKAAEENARLIITTDHGTIRVQNPSKVIGDRNTNTNLRYKAGKNLDYDKRDVFEITNPADAFLPKVNVSTSYIFALDDRFFVYPNNYNHFVNYFRNTFQHGGVSMEEMLIPFVSLKAR
ncbi:T9SS response regulator signal transducer PorX [Halocola ammonii]